MSRGQSFVGGGGGVYHFFMVSSVAEFISTKKVLHSQFPPRDDFGSLRNMQRPPTQTT